MHKTIEFKHFALPCIYSNYFYRPAATVHLFRKNPCREIDIKNEARFGEMRKGMSHEQEERGLIS